ncbi:MAG TPA: cell envelope integrity protein TolA [Opitutaceae bacterium]|nr:cell envelope integrity protein TolA [Opitutaceae bacterium]
MNARLPSAFAISALLHAVVAGLMLLAIFVSQRRESKPPVIFELVAGEGNNYGATVAPALGSPAGDVKKVAAQPAPPAPKIERAAELVTAAPPKPAPAPNFAKTIKRIEDRKIRKAEVQIKAEREAEAKRLSKEEFDRLHKQQAAAKAAAHNAKVPQIDAKGIAQGVVGGSTANTTGGAGGTALTREEGSLVEAYIAFVRQQLRASFEAVKPAGLSDQLEAVVELHILADGTLARAKIIRSSGNDDFDRAALQAVANVAPLGARPDGLPEVQQIPFRMRETEGD